MPTFSTVSQRLILAIGVVLLLGISAASIGLDVKSRSDAALVDHTLGVLKKLSDLELLVRRVESASRGFALTVDGNLLKEYRDVQDRIAPAYAELTKAIGDDAGQIRLLEASKALVATPARHQRRTGPPQIRRRQRRDRGTDRRRRRPCRDGGGDGEFPRALPRRRNSSWRSAPRIRGAPASFCWRSNSPASCRS